MLEISRTALFGKLNPLAYKAIEGATVFCKLRGNAYVELQHWLYQILNTQDSDLHRIIKHYGLDVGALTSDLTTRSLRQYLGRAYIILMWRDGRQLTQPVRSFVEDIRTL